MEEAVAKLHDREKSMILSRIEKEKLRFSVPADGGLPERVGEEAGSQSGLKGRFCTSKSFAIGSEEKSPGILLQAVSYLGRKKILKIFMPENGLVSLMAQSAQGALLSPFCIGEWVYRKGQKEIHTLKDASLTDPLLELRQSFALLSAAGSMAQDLLRTQLPSKSAPQLYELLCAYFKKLPEFSKPEILAASFKLKLLLQEGLLSLSAHCSLCDLPAFHLHRGESYCLSHAPFPGLVFTIQEWETLRILALARQFSLLKNIVQAPIEKINSLFEERIQN